MGGAREVVSTFCLQERNLVKSLCQAPGCKYLSKHFKRDLWYIYGLLNFHLSNDKCISNISDFLDNARHMCIKQHVVIVVQ